MGMIDMLRLRNIFGNPGMNPNGMGTPPFVPGEINFPTGGNDMFNPPAPVQPPPSTPPIDIMSRMQQLYTPQTEASERFESLMGEMPRQADYRPGIGRSIMSALASFGPGGHETGMDLLNQPFDRKMADWKNQIGPAKEAMINERNLNAQERQLATSALSQERMYGADRLKGDLARETQQLRRDIEEGKYKSASELAAAKAEYNNNLERLRQEGDRNLERVRQEGRESLTTMKGNEIFNIADPNDPTKQIAVRINPTTNKVERVQLDGSQVGPVQKPGTPRAGTTKQPVNLQAIQQQTQDTLDALDAMLDIKEGKNGKEYNLKSEIKDAVGASRYLGLQYLPATQTRKGNVAINNFKAQQVLSLIGELKAQSRTGATGFGALNLKELGVLEAAANKLDPALDEADFLAELKRIRERLVKILQPEDGMTNTITSRPKTADDYIQQYSK